MKKLILLTIGLILVVALLVLVKSQKNLAVFEKAFIPSSPTPFATNSSSEVSPTPPVNTHIVGLTIKDNKLIKGPSTIQVDKNQMVILQITSDADDELSVLGYNKHVFLQKGQTVILSFLSTLSGDFTYQLESVKKVLGNIKVGE